MIGAELDQAVVVFKRRDTPVLDQNKFASPSSHSELEALLQLAMAGHEESLGALFEKYRAYLKLIATKGMDDAVQAKLSGSDLVQDTFVCAKQNFRDFRGSTPNELRSWLRQILVNNLLDHYRMFRETQKRDVSLERGIQDLAAEPTDKRNKDTPSQVAMKREEFSRLDQAMTTLPEEFIAIIDLRHREQLSFAEIGRRLGQSPDAIRFSWYRAVDLLSKRLQSK